MAAKSSEGLAKTFETANRRYGIFHDNPHPHDCMGMRMHLWDMDSRAERLGEAGSRAEPMVNAAVNAMDSSSIKDWVKKNNKISLQGFLTSWIYGAAQTGDAAALQQKETDLVTRRFNVVYPATWIASVPSLPFLPEMPGGPHWPMHTLTWDGTLNVHWEGDL